MMTRSEDPDPRTVNDYDLLAAGACQCRRVKRVGHAFCPGCMDLLPPELLYELSSSRPGTADFAGAYRLAMNVVGMKLPNKPCAGAFG